jgi:predicted enzyme related to lactoylglutathione lyase
MNSAGQYNIVERQHSIELQQVTYLKLLLPILILMLIGWDVSSAASNNSNSSPAVGAVSKLPTNTFYPGKAIWVDLITTDIDTAAKFYRHVFKWSFNFLANNTYAEASYQGQPIGAFTLYEKGEAVAGDAQWLVSFSSSDIDGAIEKTIKAGGKVLEGPIDLAGRGRLLLISDPEGARLLLLHSTGGDPLDRPANINEWLWAELWAYTPSSSAEFYRDVLGLKSLTVDDSSGNPYMLLGYEGIARAGIVDIPFKGVEPNWLPYLLVDNVEKTIVTIKKYDGKLLMVLDKNTDGAVSAIVADPTGGVFAIQQR